MKRSTHISSTAPLVLAVVASTLAPGCDSREPRVTQHGGMREVLREGRSQARVALAEATSRPHAHAVGAMAGLKGEVTIDNGAALVSRVRDGKLSSGPPEPSDQATLLTLAHVERWREVALDRAAADTELESAVESIASAAGVDAREPFPFTVEGELAALTMHVINGECPMAGDGDESGPHAPYRLRLSRPARGRLIGFYATGREGEMTHHGARSHIHAVVEHEGRTITGHVERVSVAAGAAVRVPDTR